MQNTRSTHSMADILARSIMHKQEDMATYTHRLLAGASLARRFADSSFWDKCGVRASLAGRFVSHLPLIWAELWLVNKKCDTVWVQAQPLEKLFTLLDIEFIFSKRLHMD